MTYQEIINETNKQFSCIVIFALIVGVILSTIITRGRIRREP